MLRGANTFEFFRDHAAELFEARPVPPGDRAPARWFRTLTATLIDSREFLAARRRADTEVLAPAGTPSPSPAASRTTITPESGRRSTSTRQAPQHGAAARR